MNDQSLSTQPLTPYKDGNLLTMEGDVTNYVTPALTICDSIIFIRNIAQVEEKYPDAVVNDLSERIMMPGFIKQYLQP
ncbi:MAG: hypothetical protein AAGC88_15855 [Bacteroidota bacterium]